MHTVHSPILTLAASPSRVVRVALVFGLAACAANAEPDLLVPDTVSVAWSDAYDGTDDGLGAVVPVDVMVYDSATGAALQGVELAIASEHDGTWVVPAGRVVAADAPRPDAAGLDPASDPLAGAAAWLQDAEVDSMQVLFDTRHDRFVTIDADRGELLAGATTVVTNSEGVARVLLFVDRFPAASTTDWADVAVVVSASGPVPLERVVLLQPE